jgi:hypothetical protein
MSQYQISKKRLAQIIKEEYRYLQHRKTRRLNEDANDDTFAMVDTLQMILGPEQALEDIVQAMERSQAHKILKYVMRQREIPLEGEPMAGDEVEDYDPSAYNRTDEKLTLDQVESDEEDTKDEELEEGYMDALDRSRDDDARARRRQMQRIRDEEERKRQSGGYRRPGAGSGMGGIGGGGSGKKRFAGFNRKDEASKPDYIDLDKDGNTKEPMKKAAKDKKKMKKESLNSIRQLIKQELKKL